MSETGEDRLQPIPEEYGFVFTAAKKILGLLHCFKVRFLNEVSIKYKHLNTF